MNKLIMRTTILVVGVLACVLSGCVSPLKSDNPATRKRAVEEISDQKELFFIAMNIDVYYKGVLSRREARLRPGEYLDDVRVMAVQKIKDPKYLVKCAMLHDNDVYYDPPGESGKFIFEFKGETSNRYSRRMNVKVAVGDAVRTAAAEVLAKPEIFRMLSKVYEEPHDVAFFKDDYGIKSQLFPQQEASLYVNSKGWGVRPNNPLNQVIVKAAEKQTSEDVIAVLTSCSKWLPIVAPLAYDQCLRNKLDGITDADARRLYENLFPDWKRGGKSSAIKWMKFWLERGDYSKEYKDAIAMMRSWPWLIYQHIANPNLEIVQSALANSDSKLFEGIISKVTDPEVLIAIKERNWDIWRIDLEPDAAARILEKFNNQHDLARLAKEGKIKSIRTAAIGKLNDDAVLVEIASDSDMPNDLREAAIYRIKDVKALRVIRKNASRVNLNKAAALRLLALGESDVAEICANETYDVGLFSMLTKIKQSSDFAQIASTAKLKGVRMIAASKLSQTEYETIAKKEAVDDDKCAAGKINIGGFYLGMNIETAYAMIVAKYPSVKPTMRLEGSVLCLIDVNGQNLAWADVRTREIHWLTLTPEIVKRTVGFTSGSFDDLENAVEHMLSVSFGSDIVRNGEVSQNIGNLETTEGETLRFFKSDLTMGEDLGRSARKALYKYAADIDPLNINAGIQVAFANEYENAMQAGENNRNAKSPRFAPRGSLQLQFTRNAIKGSRGATGRWR